jgi:uncharacterized LabA/DUF88 family protein
MMADLKRRMMQYETAIEQSSAQLRTEAAQREAFERERSELLTRVATREHARREAELERRKLEHDRRMLTDRIAALEAERTPLSPQRLGQLEAEAQRHRDRADALERALTHAADANALQQLQQQLESSQGAHATEVEQLQQQLVAMRAMADEDQAALQQRLDQARAELKAARQQLAGTSSRPHDGEARVAVLLDDANLSLSARRSFAGRLDYRALVTVVLGGRRRGPVIAFVVSSEDASRHAGFARSLRDAGIDVREKRARSRADGSRKADWDMGIAMEALDRLDDYDVFVLGSGDGDFLPLLQRLRAHGKRVEVASFAASSEEQLLRSVDAVHALDERIELRGER